MTAEELIGAELARQDRMWGEANERADSTKGQLFYAAMAQLMGLEEKISLRDNPLINEDNEFDCFGEDSGASVWYPEDWTGLRDYGSDIANLVVAVSYLTQEIRRKLRAGEDTTRTSRNVETQPYTADQPAIIEA